MSKFYFLLWLRWAIVLTFLSVILAFVIAAFITLFTYINQGTRTLDTQIYQALYDIFKFWFALSWSFTVLLSLFISLKFVFNRCTAHYKLNLLSCPNKSEISYVLEKISYGDLVKVWRKWFMLLIWLVGAQMIFILIFMKFFSSYTTLFEWFNIYILYIFVLIAGYFSFMILSGKCKKVKVAKC
ncbi:hypothetical protein [Sulfurimonas sp.]